MAQFSRQLATGVEMFLLPLLLVQFVASSAGPSAGPATATRGGLELASSAGSSGAGSLRALVATLQQRPVGTRLKDVDPAAALELTFGTPVVMPLSCPQAKCKFGGSVGADSFLGFGASSLGNVLGSVNKRVVWSSDSGATFVVLPSAVAKEGLANSAVGPGLSYHDGPGVGTTGVATMNQTSHPSTAIGHSTSQWNVTSVTPSPGAGWWRAKGDPEWAIKRTVVPAEISWQLPFGDICTFSDYSGTPVHARGVWLKTVVVKTNCSKPPTGWGDPGGPGTIHLFESTDLLEWRWRSLVAAGNATGGAEEGANENDICVLDDGSLLVVFRRDGGDGWPDHAHRSFMEVRSVNRGESWSAPTALPAHVRSARPQLLKFPGGPLFLTGGRPYANCNIIPICLNFLLKLQK